MSRTGKVVLGLVALQAGLVGAYMWVESSRSAEAPFLSEELDLPAPRVVFEGRDGPVAVGDGRTVVHFWATWCAPCVTELPALLAAAESEGVVLLAATDEPWPVVERYFGGAVPNAIVRDPSAVGRAAYEVSGLPDTFVVEDGRIVGRVGGPREWSTATATEFLTDDKR